MIRIVQLSNLLSGVDRIRMPRAGRIVLVAVGLSVIPDYTSQQGFSAALRVFPNDTGGNNSWITATHLGGVIGTGLTVSLWPSVNIVYPQNFYYGPQATFMAELTSAAVSASSWSVAITVDD